MMACENVRARLFQYFKVIMQGSQKKVLTSCGGHVHMFHCGLPRGPMHSVTLTLTGVYQRLQKGISTLFIYSFGIRILVLCVGLHGCKTWFLTLREEHRLTVFENRVLIAIFGRMTDEMT
ncbi:hypothetical protein L798_00240 [Zootermopsis nevadensis]|uniref:Uncharacterized protein n=1 Tax=Zootermopsis nevadensis TaxID=136037 RepID=A0A067QVP9_ZOONE|nr:hypothetical protein L798_00240 [Zootermopsis nevadensis]